MRVGSRSPLTSPGAYAPPRFTGEEEAFSSFAAMRHMVSICAIEKVSSGGFAPMTSDVSLAKW